MTDDWPLLLGTIHIVRSLSFIVLMFAGTGYEMMLLFAIINSHCQRAEEFSGAASPLVAPVPPEPGENSLPL